MNPDLHVILADFVIGLRCALAALLLFLALRIMRQVRRG